MPASATCCNTILQLPMASTVETGKAAPLLQGRVPQSSEMIPVSWHSRISSDWRRHTCPNLSSPSYPHPMARAAGAGCNCRHILRVYLSSGTQKVILSARPHTMAKLRGKQLKIPRLMRHTADPTRERDTCVNAYKMTCNISVACNFPHSVSHITGTAWPRDDPCKGQQQA